MGRNKEDAGFAIFHILLDLGGRKDVGRRHLSFALSFDQSLKLLSSLEFNIIIRESLVQSSVTLHQFIQ